MHKARSRRGERFLNAIFRRNSEINAPSLAEIRLTWLGPRSSLT